MHRGTSGLGGRCGLPPRTKRWRSSDGGSGCGGINSGVSGGGGRGPRITGWGHSSEGGRLGGSYQFRGISGLGGRGGLPSRIATATGGSCQERLCIGGGINRGIRGLGGRGGYTHQPQPVDHARSEYAWVVD